MNISADHIGLNEHDAELLLQDSRLTSEVLDRLEACRIDAGDETTDRSRMACL